MSIDGVGLVEGEVVGFNRRIVVIALPPSVSRVSINRLATMTLGIDEHNETGISGTTLTTLTHPDGRRCVAIELNDSDGSMLRRHIRVAWETRIDALMISSRESSDQQFRFTSFDISAKGVGAHGVRPIPVAAEVLLRFAVPPHRGAVLQIRSTVAYCRPAGHRVHQVGFEFTRLSRGKIQLLHAAVVHLADIPIG